MDCLLLVNHTVGFSAPGQPRGFQCHGCRPCFLFGHRARPASFHQTHTSTVLRVGSRLHLRHPDLILAQTEKPGTGRKRGGGGDGWIVEVGSATKVILQEKIPQVSHLIAYLGRQIGTGYWMPHHILCSKSTSLPPSAPCLL